MASVAIIPALSDNYIYLLTANHQAAVVDPGEAAPVLALLQKNNLPLTAIVLTHRHGDHLDGVGELRRRWPQAQIYAPANCVAEARLCAGGDFVDILNGALTLQVIATPGHTMEHVAFYGGGMLFCGDTLFVCGCGRVFEGSMEQMYGSLARLAALPDDTLIYCGHEYTAGNVAFAMAVEPDNAALQKKHAAIAARPPPSVPTTMGEEKQYNPFLRLTAPAVTAAAKARNGGAITDETEVFAVLRRWKDAF